MLNQFGQDIQEGDIVGLGIRAGNGSEQRVGIVLELLELPRRYWYGQGEAPKDAYGKCAWYDSSQKTIWKTDENGKKVTKEVTRADGSTYPAWVADHYEDAREGRVMVSRQEFRFFKLDPATLDPEIVQHLQAAWGKHAASART